MTGNGTYQLLPNSPKWESGWDGRYQTVYLPVTVLETGKISWSIWPTEKAGRAAGRDSQIVACQLARCRSAEGCGSPAATSKGHRPFEAPTEPTGETSSLQGSRVKPLPSDMMLCVISYWIYYLAQNGGRSSSFAASFFPGKMLKRRLEKSFIVRLFTYNK